MAEEAAEEEAPQEELTEEELAAQEERRRRAEEKRRRLEEEAEAERLRLEAIKAQEEADANDKATLWQNAVGQEVDCAVIWLHGHGESEVAWQLLMKSVELPMKCGRVRWVWPRAPIAPSSVRGSAMTTQWFDVKEFPICRVVRGTPDRPRISEDPTEVDEAVRRIRAVVRALEVEGIPPSRIILGGFGMGAALVLQTVLRAEEAFAGGVMCSGWIACPEGLDDVITDVGRNTDLLWCHGARDAVVEMELAGQSAKRLKESGIPLRFRLFPELAFDFNDEVLKVVQTFIGERLDAGLPAPEGEEAPLESSEGAKGSETPGEAGDVPALR